MEQKLPIVGLNASLTDTSNQIGALKCFDGYIDSREFFVKRPGLSTLTTTGVSGDIAYASTGIFYWPTYNTNIVFFENRLYTLNSSNVLTYRGDLSTHTGVTTDQVNTSIAHITGQEVMVCSRGTDIDIYHPITHAITHITPSVSGAPSDIVRTQYLDGYVIAQVETGNKFYWSELDDPTTWNPLDFATAETVADDITNITVKNGKIYVFGQKSIEVFYNDGVSPFARLDGGQESVGCIASNSVINTDLGIFFLDSNRRVTRLTDSGLEILSEPVDKLIETFTTISDAYFHFVYMTGKQFLLCFFPSSGVRSAWDGGMGTGMCLVYDIQNKNWYDWTSWYNYIIAYREMFRVRYHTYAVSQKRNIFLINNLARPIATLSSTVYQERGLESAPYSSSNPQLVDIHSEWRSGNNSWGTSNLKVARSLKIRANKETTSSNLYVTGYDDDNITVSTRTIDLSGSYTGTNWYQLNQLGDYKIRSYKFEHNSNSPFVFGELYEDIQVNKL